MRGEDFVPCLSLENAHRLRLLYCAAWSVVSPLLAIRGLVVARFSTGLSTRFSQTSKNDWMQRKMGVLPHASEITGPF